jgi:hypothetical protein
VLIGVSFILLSSIRQDRLTGRQGWAKFMEWKYPVEVVVTNKAAFKMTGAVEAAASL